ncbi:MFS transporter [Actinomadura sp. 7K507]|uniref:MFS transporter n=1 Tax=Actinomadura sp. 7K507 TaxID=2530365 RepID=UPI00104502A3|nr:MFS transporter [Actinomadura sp. 7K507]TDC98457.1 MFS transporter [Actinomadura sp. 7K507]
MSDLSSSGSRARGGRAERTSRVWPLYAGGFLGPYAGTMVTPILHEVADGLDSTPEAATAAVTAYMIPFAALLLVSGTWTERWGRRRTMRASLAVFVLASALCALAPTIETFLAGRVLQGATNAFTTPLLVAAISDSTPRERLGRALGLFAAMQAAGQTFSPLVSGVSAAVDWRLAFVFPSAVALALALLPPSEAATARRSAGRASWRVLANRRLATAAALSFLCYLPAMALTIIAILRADERFGLGPAERGLVGAGFGIAGLVCATTLGRLLDRLGPRRLGLAMNVLLAAGLLTAALGPTLTLLVCGVVLTGIAVPGLRSTVNSLAAGSAPSNRAGATSLALSAQFFGGALAPVLCVPLYAAHGEPAFAATAAAPALAILLLLSGRLLTTDRGAPR